MLIAIPDVFDRAAVLAMREALLAADWVDGNVTSGPQSALAKRNRQLPEDSPVAIDLGGRILDALGQTPLFIAAALPLKVFPPLFNRYGEGEGFGLHVDNAIRLKRGSDFRIRSDLSVTLFLSDPDEYDGGELRVKGNSGAHSIKLPAGHLVLYHASSLHHVTPVTRGERLASFFWVQSMVRDDNARTLLLELDQTIQSLTVERGQADGEIIKLTGIYHNLLRMWADA